MIFSYRTPYARRTTWQHRSVSPGNDDKEGQPKVVNCEKEGSCRVVRGALKAEMNDRRMAKRQQGIGEDNYLEMLGGSKPPTNSNDAGGKKYGISKPSRPQPQQQ